MPRKLDPFWEYGEPDSPNDRLNLTCKLCGHPMSGGLYKLKFHLAKIPRKDVGPCKNTTPELIQRALRALENLEQTREAKEELKRQLKRSAEGSGPSGTSSTTASTNLIAATSFFVPRTTPGTQPSIGSMLKRTKKEQANKSLAKFLLLSDIPFSIVRNNPFFQPVVDAIASVGPGYKIPSYHDFRGRILQNEKRDCTQRLKDFRASWAQTECTVMSDGWTDQKGRTLINFLVSCPKGTMFIKSVDASAQIKDARTLCDLLDVFILEVGEQNVVQVTDNAANYVAAGRILMDRHPTLFWTPCAAHCIDLMLEDIAKIPFVKDIVDSSKSTTKFIYNHTSVLSLVRRFTNNKELEVCAVTEPLVKILQLVDGEKPAMGYLYEAMDRAKEAIRAYYDDKGDDRFQRQFLLWGVIDERWNNTLHRPIHAAGLFLNPTFSYACGFDFDAKIMDELLPCVQKMVRSLEQRIEIS
eukprot:PITA_01667